VSHNPPFDDLLELNGDGLRREPLAVRKATLETTVRAALHGARQREQC
jgi:ATP-dependent DNA ligase